MNTRIAFFFSAVVSTVVSAADPSPRVSPGATPTKLTAAERADLDDIIRRVAAARKQPVPLPKTTPYDQDAKARQEYLAAYAEGYRQILAENMIGCNMQVADGYQHARLAGIGDGKKQAEKDHPEHYRRMMGFDQADKK